MVATRAHLRRFQWLRDDVITLGAVIVLALLLLIGLAGSLLGVGGDPAAIVGDRLKSPSSEFLLGTDSLGRSLLARVIDGIGTTVVLSSFAVLIAATIGTGLALIAAYAGGWVDQIVVRLADVLFSFPVILLAIVVAAIVGPGETAVIVSIVVATVPLMLRVVRSEAIGLVDRDFVRAAKVGGASTSRLLAVHLLPNVGGVVAVQATYAISIGMVIESGLSFLGLGVQAPRASLGSLLSENRLYLAILPWSVIGPGVVLALAILSVNLVGDGLRDRLEPRQARALS